MGILSSTLLSGIGAVAILIGYGAIRKERSSRQNTQQTQSPQTSQKLHAIAQEHTTLKAKHQKVTAANHTLEQQIATLIAEKAALQNTLDRAWEKAATLEAQLTAVTEQLNPSAPEQAVSLETQSTDIPSEVAPPSLMPKPSLPHHEDTLNADTSAIETTTNIPATVQNTPLSSADTPTEKEIETVYEIEDAIASEDNIRDQAISAEPNPLQGKSVAISGIFKDITPAEIKERLQAVGGRLHSHSGANTDYLVVGDTSSDTLQRAEKLKIPQLTEEQFLNLLKESEVLVREES